MVNAGETKFSPFFFRIFPLKCSVFNLPYYSIKEGRNKVKSGGDPPLFFQKINGFWRKTAENTCLFPIFVLGCNSICNVGRGKQWLVPFA